MCERGDGKDKSRRDEPCSRWFQGDGAPPVQPCDRRREQRGPVAKSEDDDDDEQDDDTHFDHIWEGGREG